MTSSNQGQRGCQPVLGTDIGEMSGDIIWLSTIDKAYPQSGCGLGTAAEVVEVKD